MENFEFTEGRPAHSKGFLDESSSQNGIAQSPVSGRSNPAPLTDEEVPATELVRRFNNGDETAFVEMMRRYQSKIFAIALRILHNRADAEEITQDTFIRAHRGLARFRGDSSLMTWLHRIAMNLARNRYWYYFRRKSQVTLSLDYSFGDEGESTFSDLLASEAPDPCREAVTNEFSNLVDRCMEKLDPGHRKALVMRNTLDSSYQEIAKALNLNVGTVKSRVSRARKNLRERLAQACPEFAADAAPSAWFEAARSAGRIATA
jgi:RNA polymerase sigma-70 factor (ECF subfamily)